MIESADFPASSGMAGSITHKDAGRESAHAPERRISSRMICFICILNDLLTHFELKERVMG